MCRKFTEVLTVFSVTCLFSLQSLKAQLNLPFWRLSGNSVGANTSFGTTNNAPLRIITNKVEKIRVTENGLVGIGTITPLQKLHVVGQGLFTSGLSVSNGGISVLNSNGIAVSALGHKGISSIGTNIAIEAITDGLNNIGVLARNLTNGPAITAQSNSGVGIFANGSVGVNATGFNTGAILNGVSFGLQVNASGSSSTGVYSLGNFSGVTGVANGTDPNARGVSGFSDKTYGVVGFSNSGNGVYGYTNGLDDFNNVVSAVYGECQGYGVGVRAFSRNGAGVFAYSTGTYAGYFSGNVYSTGMYLGSDRKLKKNIAEVTSALDIINKLQPKTYEFREDGNYKLMNLPKGKHFGLLAHELEQVLPGLVKETSFNTAHAQPMEKIEAPSIQPLENSKAQMVKPKNSANEKSEVVDFKSVNYMELIPIMIKGMQELSQEKKELQQQINQLKEIVSKLTKDQIITTSVNSGVLLQNVPNPVKSSTSIMYTIPDGVKKAQLLIADNLGRTIKRFELNASGIINVDISTLSSGVYNYTLIIDSKPIQSRKMTVIN